MPSARVVARYQRCSVLATAWAPQRPVLLARKHPCPGILGLHAPGIAEVPQHFGGSPPGLQKPCCTTPGKGTVVVRNGNSERLVGLATLPELVQVLLQLAQGLLGNLPPVMASLR